MPAQFTIERSATIDAPATAIWPHLIDFRRWQSWSPWEGLDPDMKRQYSEPSGGAGASYGWAGNRKAGEGRMEILEATEPTHLRLALHFLKPWKASNDVTFRLVESGGSTTVTWTMTGEHKLAMRVFGIFMSLDKLVGKDFEKGLDALKREAEAGVTVA